LSRPRHATEPLVRGETLFSSERCVRRPSSSIEFRPGWRSWRSPGTESLLLAVLEGTAISSASLAMFTDTPPRSGPGAPARLIDTTVLEIGYPADPFGARRTAPALLWIVPAAPSPSASDPPTRCLADVMCTSNPARSPPAKKPPPRDRRGRLGVSPLPGTQEDPLPPMVGASREARQQVHRRVSWRAGWLEIEGAQTGIASSTGPHCSTRADL